MPTHAQKPAAENRRARRDYEIERTLEAGLVLSGSEVKSLRLQRADLTQSWAGGRGGELFLFNADIPAYTHAIGRNHEPKRQRKLLVHKKERTRLLIAVQQKGLTLVPLKLYFNARGRAKLLLGLGRGRRQLDKRAVEKTRDWERQKSRLLRREQASSKARTKAKTKARRS
ncbi:MAG: SsrA-binding protein SmpB [Hyphomicrobiales bacterium]|nr:SsrA-binding protein SmpB [Hyphomicrobiales bacterium]